MTYGELKALCLQKVFAMEGDRIVEDDSTRGFLTALPGAVNEALALLSTAGKPLVRRMDIPVGPREGSDPLLFRNLKELDRDFLRLLPGEIYFAPKGEFPQSTRPPQPPRLRQNSGYRMEGEASVWLDGSREGVWVLYYQVYPKWVDAKTGDEEEIALPPEAARLIPLYVASQLYKDDDLAIATQYRNEFEAGRGMLALFYNDDNGREFTSVTGWI